MMVDDVSVPTSQKFIYFHQSDHTDRPCPQHSTVALLYDRCNLAALITIPIINGILKLPWRLDSIVSHLASIHKNADCMYADYSVYYFYGLTCAVQSYESRQRAYDTDE